MLSNHHYKKASHESNAKKHRKKNYIKSLQISVNIFCRCFTLQPSKSNKVGLSLYVLGKVGLSLSMYLHSARCNYNIGAFYHIAVKCIKVWDIGINVSAILLLGQTSTSVLEYSYMLRQHLNN